ncbi:type VI secretion system-associated protein TagF [Propylenella binzhouense]|uniref:Type VI secretion system-associated protein TagF n=1 Tax=Propylenella binzhouense TaxID=2555902 RepID=A0A964WVP5_9HYPH|nr:type VI secretion system-associated protein TagF [Propylenella binzhouense]MYZ50268.1 type VI secretion system-associated protein TagF [Propylenella binzhouense]
MAIGVFGKLPQKRDFVALGLPHRILAPFETWLQSAVAASRNELGQAWETYYLVAPIWRFWIGRDVFGESCAGALMPSVDKVGRFFPLAVIHHDAARELLEPPTLAPQDPWYAALEARLLSVLDEGRETELEAFASGLPDYPAAAEASDMGTPFKGGITWEGEAARAAGAFMASLAPADYRQAAASRSFWWTQGGGAGKPLAYAGQGLPDPYFFSRMLLAPAARTPDAAEADA